MIFSKKILALSSAGLVLFGVLISSLWFSLYNPMKPLYVEVVNSTGVLIPTVVIEHGQADLQEKITIVRLKPNESRIIALNHQPGMGFNILANFLDGTKSEICGGKSKDVWFFREIITKFGIYTTSLR